MAVNRAVSSHLPWLIVNQSGTTSRVGMFPIHYSSGAIRCAANTIAPRKATHAGVPYGRCGVVSGRVTRPSVTHSSCTASSKFCTASVNLSSPRW